MRLTVAIAALLFATLFMLACNRPSKSDLIGQYVLTGGPSGQVTALKADGSFSVTVDNRVIKHGRWHITRDSVFDSGVEFDVDSGPSVQASADEYRLTMRNGERCWEVRRDYDYWCRTSASNR